MTGHLLLVSMPLYEECEYYKICQILDGKTKVILLSYSRKLMDIIQDQSEKSI